MINISWHFFITNCKYYCDAYRQLSSCINILKVKIYFHILNLFITGKLFTPIEVNLLKENFSKNFLKRFEHKHTNKVPQNIHKKSIDRDAFLLQLYFKLNRIMFML